MKPGITSGGKISDASTEGRKYHVEVAIRNLLVDNGFYWARSPMSRKKEHYEDRIEFNSIVTLTDILKLDNVSNWHDRVKLKEEYIRANPGTVFWDFAEHILLITRPSKSSWYGIRRLIKVSTEGEVVSVGKWGMRRLKGPAKEDGEYYVSHRFYDGQYMLHRIVASTFVYTEGNPEILEVNHLDGIKFHNWTGNVEWSTRLQNQRHAVENDLMPVKRVLMEMVVPNQFEGRKFVLKGSREITHVISSIGTDRVHFGCHASEISLEDSLKYHQGFPEDILKAYEQNRGYFTFLSCAFLGTVEEGPDKGHQFAIVGNKHAKREGVSTSGIGRCLEGTRKTHRNCSWKRISLKEASLYPQTISVGEIS